MVDGGNFNTLSDVAVLAVVHAEASSRSISPPRRSRRGGDPLTGIDYAYLDYDGTWTSGPVNQIPGS